MTNTTFPFKLAIFDLDLTLWDGNKLYSDIHSILKRLKSQNIKLYIASYNLSAMECCKMLEIEKYFDGIYYGRGTTKNTMIKNIMQQNINIKENEIIFFDDQLINFKDLNKKIKTIHCKNGLSWINIPVRFVSKQVVDEDVHINYINHLSHLSHLSHL